MRLGPLRFLAAVGLGLLAWCVSRVPVIIELARIDVAAVAASEARVLAAAAQTAVAPTYRRHSSEGRNPVALQVQGSALAVQLGSGLRRNDGLIEYRPAPPTAQGITIASGASSANRQRIAGPSVEHALAETLAPISMPHVQRTDNPTAFDLATAAYGDLARHDRRAAAQGFAAALAATPDAQNTTAWRGELAALRKQWAGEAYVLVRGAGPTSLGVAPLLGGGQSGATIAFTPDPLARRPLAVVARAVVAHEGAGFGIAGIDRRSAQAALGVRWQPTRGVSLTAERLITAGSEARDAWVLRAAGGASQRIGPVLLDSYAEAGVVGARRLDTFASAQTRAALPLPAGFDAGAGAWASVQYAATTVHRVDLGPTVGWHHGPFTARADWRFRVTGNAAPGSGPALTLSARF